VVDVGDEHLGLENLTICPIDRNLINKELLEKKHI